MAELPTPDYAYRMRMIGHTDQGGRPDGVQLMVHNGFAYTGHMFSKGFSIVDVRDPKNPKPAGYFAAPHRHLEHPSADPRRPAAGHQRQGHVRRGRVPGRAGLLQGCPGQEGRHGGRDRQPARSWTAGMAVYDISKPAEPRQIGFMPIEGGGVHRIWYTGGRWAYASALIDGFTDYIFITIDMADPTKPVEAGRWWIPGMNQAAGETPSWPAERRFGLHHPIVHGDVAYCAWRDAGMVVLDVADRARPKLIVHRNWSPPFGGGTHNCLPLPKRELLCVLDEAVLDNLEDGLKLIWLFDNRVVANPISISTLPVPTDADYPTRAPIAARTMSTRTGRRASRARTSSSPPCRTPACASTTSATSTSRSRSVRWCRPPRRAWSTTAPAGRG